MPAHPSRKELANISKFLPRKCMAEPFGIPAPDELIFISWFTGGEVFRSGCTWYRVTVASSTSVRGMKPIPPTIFRRSSA